jgi:hypothetical protein
LSTIEAEMHGVKVVSMWQFCLHNAKGFAKYKTGLLGWGRPIPNIGAIVCVDETGASIVELRMMRFVHQRIPGSMQCFEVSPAGGTADIQPAKAMASVLDIGQKAVNRGGCLQNGLQNA